MIVILSFFSTFAVFGVVGFLLSRKFKRPVETATWIALALGAGLCQWILPELRVVSGGDFTVAFNYMLEALFLGILAGLVQREVKLRVH